MAIELIWPYVNAASNPTVDGYVNWVKNQKNDLYNLKFEQVSLVSYFTN